MKRQLPKTGISVFFPCYNDAGTIGIMVDKAFKNLKKITRDYEVIVIDDGSSDNSRNILLRKAKQYDKLKLIFHRKNRGYGGALKSGFKAASKDLVFYTDGDAQYDVDELPILFDLLTDDVDVVNGIKMERHDYAYRVVMGNAYAFVVRWLFRLPIWDVDCDFRLIRRKFIKKIKLKSNSGSICVELVKKLDHAGASFRQVSVHHYDRIYGQSQFFRIDRLLKTFVELSSLWWQLMVNSGS